VDPLSPIDALSSRFPSFWTSHATALFSKGVRTMKDTPTMDLLTPWMDAQQSVWERWRDVSAQTASRGGQP
jgi:hypothetical protein